MKHTQISSCPQCGAPIYVPTIWYGVMPPPPMYSCNCVGYNQHYGSNTTNTPVFPMPVAVPSDRRGFGYKFPPRPWDIKKQQLEPEKNSQKAMEKLFEEFENLKKEEIENAVNSLGESFNNAGLLTGPTISEREKFLLEKIELLERKLQQIQGVLEIKE